MIRWLIGLGLLALQLPGPVLAADQAPAVGSWAIYRRASSLTQDVSVITREATSGGGTTWSVGTQSVPAAELFVTYSVPRGDAKSYVLQIVTHDTPDGPPLSVTQVTVDRATGKARRSVIRRPQGVIATPEDALRPLTKGALSGTPDAVTVPAGRFEATRAPYRGGTVWVADGAGPLGIVRLTGPRATLELVRQGTGGTKDLLRP